MTRKKKTLLNKQAEKLKLPQMLDRFVHVARGPMIIDIANIRKVYTPLEFKALYAHCRRSSPRGGSIEETALWKQHPSRLTADRRTFAPDRGRFFREDNLINFNTWEAPTWPEVDPKYAAMFFDHVAYVIPGEKEREDFLDWTAHGAQKPGERPHLGFLLVAPEQGIGRSWIGDALGMLWSKRNAVSVDLHRLLQADFNAELSEKIMVVVNEVKAPDDQRYSFNERLNSLFSDTTIVVNDKHEKKWTENFCARFLMFSNRDNALPLKQNDRRVYVVKCAKTPKPQEYYDKLYPLLKDRRFLAAVWTALMGRDISHFSPGMRAPLNRAKRAMIDAGRSEEQREAVDFVNACPHDFIVASDLMETLAPYQGSLLTAFDKQRRNAITAVLKEIGYETFPDLLSAHVSAHFRVISGGGPGILGYLGGASSIKARV